MSTNATHLYLQNEWSVPHDGGIKRFGSSVLIAAAICAPMLAAGFGLIRQDQVAAKAAEQALLAQFNSHDRLSSSPALPQLALNQIIHGKALFETSCGACHKKDGTGIEDSGKDLTRSWFVASRDDARLSEFIARGRSINDSLNTTKAFMPPKGGHAELTAADLTDIVTYIRGLQDPRRMPPLPAEVLVAAPAAPTEAEKAQALAAAGGDAELAEYIAHGSTLYGSTCSSCHGKDARGLPTLGKDLVHSQFCKSLDDDALLAFVKRGRDPSDPANTTKVGMPPKGGNPALSDDDLLDIITYVRSLQKKTTATN